MIVSVVASPCYHAQEVLVGCFSTDDARPYALANRKRAKCRYCRQHVADVMLIVGEDDDKKAQECPFAIDVSVVKDNQRNAELQCALKDANDELAELQGKSVSVSETIKIFGKVVSAYLDVTAEDPANTKLRHDYGFFLKQAGLQLSMWKRWQESKKILCMAHQVYGLLQRDGVDVGEEATEVKRLLSELPDGV